MTPPQQDPKRRYESLRESVIQSPEFSSANYDGKTEILNAFFDEYGTKYLQSQGIEKGFDKYKSVFVEKYSGVKKKVETSQEPVPAKEVSSTESSPSSPVKGLGGDPFEKEPPKSKTQQDTKPFSPPAPKLTYEVQPKSEDANKYYGELLRFKNASVNQMESDAMRGVAIGFGGAVPGSGADVGRIRELLRNSLKGLVGERKRTGYIRPEEYELIQSLNKRNAFDRPVVKMDSETFKNDPVLKDLSWIEQNMLKQIQVRQELMDISGLRSESEEGIPTFDADKTYSAAKEIAAMLGGGKYVKELAYETLRSEVLSDINHEKVMEVAAPHIEAFQKELGADVSESFQKQSKVLANATTQASAFRDKVSATASAQSDSLYADFSGQMDAFRDNIQKKVDAGEMDSDEGQQAWRVYAAKTLDEYNKQVDAITNAARAEYRNKVAKLESGIERDVQREFEAFAKNQDLTDDQKLRYRAIIDDAQRKVNDEREAILLATDYGDGAPSQFYRGFVNSVGRSISATSKSLGWQDGVVFGDALHERHKTSSGQLNTLADVLNPIKFTNASSQLAGSMAISMGAGIAVGAATSGTGTVPAMASVMLASWGAETMDMMGQSYRDMLDKTGSQSMASQAADEMFDAQLKNMWTYSLDGLPIIGKALKGVPTLVGRIVVGAGAELGTEFLQEAGQGLQEQQILNTGTADGWTDGWTSDYALKTFYQISPVALMGGGAQIIHDPKNSQANARAFRAMAKNPDYRGSFQFTAEKVATGGAKLLETSYEAAFQDNKITKAQLDAGRAEIKIAQMLVDEAKARGMSPTQQMIYVALKEKVWKARADNEAPGSTNIDKEALSDAEKNLSEFVRYPDQGGSYAVVTMRYGNKKVVLSQRGVKDLMENLGVKSLSKIDAAHGIKSIDLKNMDETDFGSGADPKMSAEAPVKESVAPEERVATVKTKDIEADPKRFQYKADVNEDTGAAESFLDRPWNHEYAGVISVWKDPSDGKTYVINGHHRYALAKKQGVENIDVRYVNAENASDARKIGALQNISEGKGTDIDAAKVFRESGFDSQAIEDSGLSLTDAKARRGIALAGLAGPIFDAVVDKKISTNVGVIIGENIESHDLQKQFYAQINNKNYKTSTIEIMAQDMNNARVKKQTVTDLFGTTETEMAEYEQRAGFIAGIRGLIAKAKNVLGKTAKSKEFLEEFGNRINKKKSESASEEAQVALAVFDKLRNTSSEIKALIDEGTNRIENGESKSKVTADIAKKIIKASEGIIRGDKKDGGASAKSKKDESNAKKAEAVKQGPVRNMQLQNELETAQKKLKSAEAALKNKAKEIDEKILDDQEDLFGGRKSNQENQLFDARIDHKQRDNILAPLRAGVDRAKQAVKNAEAAIENHKNQPSLFDAPKEKVETTEDARVNKARATIAKVRSDVKEFVSMTIDRIKSSIPVDVIFDQDQFNTAANEMGINPNTRGFVWNEKIDLNPSKVTRDTAVHEFAHIYLAHMESVNRKLYKQGLDLAEQSEAFRIKMNDPEYSHLTKDEILNETLAELIGLAGADKLKGSLGGGKAWTTKFVMWLNQMKEYLAEKFFTNKSEGIKLMSLKEFLDGALYDMLGGNDLGITIKGEKPRFKKNKPSLHGKFYEGNRSGANTVFADAQGNEWGTANIEIKDNQTGLTKERTYEVSDVRVPKENMTAFVLKSFEEAAMANARKIAWADGVSKSDVKNAGLDVLVTEREDGTVVAEIADDAAIEVANGGKPLFQAGFSQVKEIMTLHDQLRDQGFTAFEIERALVAEGYSETLVSGVFQFHELLGDDISKAFNTVSVQDIEASNERNRLYGKKIAQALTLLFPEAEVSFTMSQWKDANEKTLGFDPVIIDGHKIAFHPDYISPSASFSVFARAWVAGAAQKSPGLMARIEDIMEGSEYLEAARKRRRMTSPPPTGITRKSSIHFDAFIDAIVDRSLDMSKQTKGFRQKIKRLLSDLFEDFVAPLRKMGIWKRDRTSADSLLKMSLEDLTTVVAEELTLNKAMSPHVRAAFNGDMADLNVYRATVSATMNTKMGGTRQSVFAARASGVERGELINYMVSSLDIEKSVAEDMMDRIEREIGFLNSLTSIQLTNNAFYNFVSDFRKFFTNDKIYLKKIKQSIEKRTGLLPDELDAEAKFQLQKSRAAHQIEALKEYVYGVDEGGVFQLSGRTSTFKKRGVHKNSLEGRMKKKGLNIDMLGNYMYALHAPERNARLRELSIEKQDAKRNELEKRMNASDSPKLKAVYAKQITQLENNELEGYKIVENGSRMSDKRAQEVLDGFTDKQKKDLKVFAEEFRQNVIQKNLDILHQNGYLNDEAYDALSQGASEASGVEWMNYVPLSIDPVFFTNKGDGTASANPHIYAAEGRGPYTEKMVVNPVKQATLALAKTIIQTERNASMVAMVKMAKANPDPSIWKVHRERTYHRFNVETSEEIGEEGGVVLFGDKDPKSVVRSTPLSPRVISRSIAVRMPNGQVMYFEPVHEGIKNMVRSQNMDGFAKALTTVAATITNFQRAAITTLNVFFGLPNVTRDIQDAMGNISVEESRYDLKGIRRKILKRLPTTAAALFGTEFLNMDTSKSKAIHKAMAYAREAAGEGVFMSWVNYDGVVDQVNRLQKLSKEGGIGAGEKYSKALAHGLFDLALTANEVFEMTTRMSVYSALRDSGLSKQQAAYAAKNITVNFELKGDSPWGNFISASFLFLRVGAKGAFRTLAALKTKDGLKFYAAITLLSYINKMLLYEMSDDDEKDKLRAMEDYVWLNNTVVYNPFNSSKPFIVPKAYSFMRVFQVLGESLYMATNKERTPYAAAADVLQSTSIVMNPVSGNQPNAVSAMLPVLANNYAEIAMNRKWNNSPIYPEYTDGLPDHLKYFPGTDPRYINSAQKLYDNTGIDVSPETMTYMVGEVAGGIFSEMERISRYKHGESSIKDTPLLRRFVYDLNDQDKSYITLLYRYIDKLPSQDITEQEKNTIWKAFNNVVNMPDEPRIGRRTSSLIKKLMWEKYGIDLSENTWQKAQAGKRKRMQESLDKVMLEAQGGQDAVDARKRIQKKIRREQERAAEIQ